MLRSARTPLPRVAPAGPSDRPRCTLAQPNREAIITPLHSTISLAAATSAALLAASSSLAQSITPNIEPRATQPPAWALPHDPAVQISEYIRCIFQDRAGNLWFGTNSDGVARYDGKSLTYLNMTEGLAGSAVRDIVQAKDGALWFSTELGLSRYLNNAFTTYTTKDGLPADDTWRLFLDRAGTLWVSTLKGVARYDGQLFTHFPIPPAEVDSNAARFGSDLIWDMCEDKDGNLWFATDGQGARKYDGKTFTSYTTKDGLAGNQVRCIIADRRHQIWLGCSTGGVTRYDGSTFRTFTPKDGLGYDRVYSMFEDRHGNLWLSTLGAGLSRYDGTTFTTIEEIGALTRPHVQSIYQDKSGALWLGCSGGLFRYNGEGFTNITRNGPWQ